MHSRSRDRFPSILRTGRIRLHRVPDPRSEKGQMRTFGKCWNGSMGRTWVKVVGMATLAVIAAGCTLNDASAPPLQGPSELGLSLSLSAIPDMLAHDGASQAQIIVQARDANGQPAR